MACETARERIVLDLYDELDAAGAAALGEHLRGCPGCAVAAAEERRLMRILAAAADPAPPEDLLEECRARLREAIAPAAARPWWSRVRPSPALAAGLFLAFGFLLGRVVPGPVGGGGARPGAGAAGQSAPVETVSDLLADKDAGRVSLRYDVRRQATLEGPPADPEIRRLLIETARDNANSGLRLEALEALQALSDHDDVRQALLDIARHDDNPGARLKAIGALAPRAGRDPEARGAILQALLGDDNPGVRVRAVDALQETRGPDVLPVFERLAREDPNDYVRLRSASYVTHAAGGGGSR
jgi:hypothetical protein